MPSWWTSDGTQVYIGHFRLGFGRDHGDRLEC